MASILETLGQLTPGASGVVRRVSCARPVARRLMEMGLLPGTRVTVTRVAPLGDPIELHVRDYALSIRRADAVAVEVAEVLRPATRLAPVPEGTA